MKKQGGTTVMGSEAIAWPIGKIALAVDGSEPSKRAGHLTRELAKALGAEVVVLHFRESAITRYGEPAGYETADETAAIVREAAEELAAAGVTVAADVAAVRPFGEASEIAAEADRLQAQLIVVGSRGLSTGRAVLQGSVSHDLIHTANGPVLVVH